MKTEVNIGDTFGQWEVIATAEPRVQNEYYLCKCTCGVEKEVFRGSLLNSRSRSCGCSKILRKVKAPVKRGTITRSSVKATVKKAKKVKDEVS